MLKNRFWTWLWGELKLLAGLLLFTFVMMGSGKLIGATPPTPALHPSHITSWRRAKASWYGPGFFFHMKKNGTCYRKSDVFVASHSFPLGTVISMVNVMNGKHIKLIVEDYSPGIDGREFDLSAVAAEKLGMLTAGVVPVRYAVLEFP